MTSSGSTPFVRLLSAWLLCGLICCFSSRAQTETTASYQQASGISAQPANVGDAKIRATAYHDSGEYLRDLASVAAQADVWIAQRAPQVRRPALVLDIDETALSNWVVIKADDFGRIIPGQCTTLPAGPCGWRSWDMLGRDPALSPTLKTFRRARAQHVAVFFITGRPVSQRRATEKNLRAAGYIGYAHLYMVADGSHYASAADYKTPIRNKIENAGYTIIANIGDQPSDLAGGHSEKDFLLPDPFYRIP